MIVFRSLSPSKLSSAFSALLLFICACLSVQDVESSAYKIKYGKGCSSFSFNGVPERKLCASALEQGAYNNESGETETTKYIHIEPLDSTVTVSYSSDEKCSIDVDGNKCDACYLCADNEVAYDCTNIPNGRCTVNKCERVLQLFQPKNERVHSFLMPLELGLPSPPKKCDSLHFPVLEDTWTNPKQPNDSMEGKYRLRMSNAKQYTLIKFNVTNLMDGVSQGVHDAVLRFKTIDDISSMSIRLPEGGYSDTRIAQDNWDEELQSHLFLSDKSLLDEMVGSVKHTQPIDTIEDLSARKWYSLDVSEVVTKNGMYTFLLKTDTPGTIVGIYGKGTEYEPELIVRPYLPYTPWSGPGPKI